jgi:acyl-CoA thioester hydrolase
MLMIPSSIETDARYPCEVSLPFEVKTYDIDFAGHVSNIVFIRWLEDLRMKVLQTYLPLDDLMKKGIAPVLAQTVIDYKKPVKLFDRVAGRMWMCDLGQIRGTLQTEISVDGSIVAIARQVGVFVTMATGRPVRAPEEFLQDFEQYKKYLPKD